MANLLQGHLFLLVVLQLLHQNAVKPGQIIPAEVSNSLAQLGDVPEQPVQGPPLKTPTTEIGHLPLFNGALLLQNQVLEHPSKPCYNGVI